MRKFMLVLAASSIAISAGYSFAQPSAGPDGSNSEANVERQGEHFKRGPVDLERFSRMEHLKSADKDGDGILSREEIEAHAMAQLVKRTADRMERRLDINRDGKVTLEEVEKHKAKRFALLDTNDDGKIDRQEMRAGKDFRKGGHFKHHGPAKHGKRFQHTEN